MNLSFRSKSLAIALFVAVGVTPLASASSITVGNDPTTQGALTDGCTNCATVIGQAFGAYGYEMGTYSFFTGGNGGNITPLLYTESGSTFTVVGIGTTQTLAAGSAQEYTFNFGLTAGTNITTANTFFGFSNSAGSLVTYDDTSGVVNGGAYVFQFAGATPTLGQQFVFVAGTTQDAYNEQLTRLYHADATAVTPEPSGLILLGTGLLTAVGAARRRFRA